MANTRFTLNDDSSWQTIDNSDLQQATFQYTFPSVPELVYEDEELKVTLNGTDTWLQENEPLLPVYFSGILLPQGTEIVDVQFDLGKSITLGENIDLPVSREPKPTSEFEDSELDSTQTAEVSFSQAAVSYSSHDMFGYNTALLNVFPVDYDAQTDKLSFYPDINVTVMVKPSESGPSPYLRDSTSDMERVAEFVDNDSVISSYSLQASSVQPTDETLPSEGPFDYVIVTSSSLEDEFQELIDHKIEQGLTATIVTTDYIYNNFDGDENGDNADRLRDFVQAAVDQWDTQWLLLGGDIDQVPYRSIYAPGSGVDGYIPTDMYFACLDGSWNGDGDSLWGEPHDGINGSDVDLMPDIAVGRAPVSSDTEATNFVNKVILYESNPHPNSNHAVFVGERLNAYTWGSDHKEVIWNEEFPTSYWTITERYDKYSWWSKDDLIGDLNDSPHVVNHDGHAWYGGNAKLSRSDVDGLSNTHPYFIYSIGCHSGAFDYSDSIAEHHLFNQNGAVGAIMNSRYGWYAGSTMLYSADYDQEFWDAVFDENILSMGDANNDSKIDNLGITVNNRWYRFLHHCITLFGDPQTEFNFPPAEIQGSKWNDLNANGIWDAGEVGLADWTIYLDENQNGQLDSEETFTVTDADGNYTFSGLAPGTHIVAEVIQPGWEPTYPIATGGYAWSDSDDSGGPTFNWRDISGVGTQLYLYDDDYAEVTLPFTFSFYGEEKNTVKISSNGYLTFGSDAWQYYNESIPNPRQPNDFIAPFWDDLNPYMGGSIYYYHDTTEDQFIVQYQGVPHYYDDGSYTFEVILDSNGSILYQYDELNGILDSVTIGVENANGTEGLQVAYNQSYVHDDLAVSIVPFPSYTHTVTLNAGEVINDIDFGNHANIINGTNQQDILIGTVKNEILNGENGKDELYGMGGDDVLNGGNAKDILVGVNPDDDNPGRGEKDILNDGNGPDTFVLGDDDHVYYDDGNPETQGLGDYGLIIGLAEPDEIQLKGTPDDYNLVEDFTVGSNTGTGIFVKDTIDELIGLVEGVTGLALNSNDFSFV